jgi:hypothetical protein
MSRFWFKRTAVAPVNPVPVTVTVVPPGTDPWLGLTEETTGAAMVVLLQTRQIAD